MTGTLQTKLPGANSSVPPPANSKMPTPTLDSTDQGGPQPSAGGVLSDSWWNILKISKNYVDGKLLERIKFVPECDENHVWDQHVHHNTLKPNFRNPNHQTDTAPATAIAAAARVPILNCLATTQVMPCAEQSSLVHVSCVEKVLFF